jgi:cytidyltransferase-like protein
MNKKKVMVFGTFDILHKGHLNYFSQARKYGDKLICVVSRDKNVVLIKDKKPRNNEKIRLNNVKNHVEKVVLGYIKNKYSVIIKYKPDVICLGYDQKASIKNLKQFNIPIIRLKSYKPQKYKSSKLS